MPQSHTLPQPQRRFGRVNWLGLYTLCRREIRRFTNIWAQTLMAPLVTAGLFVMVFSIAIGPQRGSVNGVPVTVFIAPGIMMMSVIQNAFANTSSSLISAKVQGNIIDTLMPPLSAAELTLGYMVGGMARGLFVALSIAVALGLGLGITPQHPLAMLGFVMVGALLMAALGLVAGIIANKFDQMAAITHFIVTPLAFLSGTFYSADALPPGLYHITHVNPIFYLIDGARWGMIGVSDSSPLLGMGVALVTTLAMGLLAWIMIRSGYRLKA